MDKDTEKQLNWLAQAIGCPDETVNRHDYIPIAWQVTATARHLTEMMCRNCFHRINLEAVFKHVPLVSE